jgi:hypothetical protein
MTVLVVTVCFAAALVLTGVTATLLERSRARRRKKAERRRDQLARRAERDERARRRARLGLPETDLEVVK